MTTFNCYFDVSGSQGGDAVLVAAGAVADHDSWDRFDQQWLSAMEEYGVGNFRMHDFAHFKNDYSVGWRDDPSKRQSFLQKLVQLTNEHVDRLYVSTLVLSDYRAVDREYMISETFGGEYATAQAGCVMRSVAWLMEDNQPEDAFACFVEQGDIGQDGFRKLLNVNLPALADSVHFSAKRDANNEEITPFHVSDFIAYEYHREHAKVAVTGRQSVKLRGSLQAIRENLHPKVGIITREILTEWCELVHVQKR